MTDLKSNSPSPKSPGENDGEPNEDQAFLTREREDQLWCQIGEAQEQAYQLGLEFAKSHGRFPGLERAVHLDLSQETGWGILAKDVFEALCGEVSGEAPYNSEDTFWREMFSVTTQLWHPTSVQIVAFVEGVCAFWTPVREEFGL